MRDEPMLLLLLGSGLVFVFVFAVLLWKLLITTVGITTVQWAVVTGMPDEPVAQVLALGIPALLSAFVLLYLPRIAGRVHSPIRSSRVRVKGAHR
ncbi:hypothetical protein LFM09_41980 [Lentzea alba]|uniref:hypothetical protein n=1 Tax=Lentzea alba TaxID=2714351 RepID=UPI0039BFC212